MFFEDLRYKIRMLLQRWVLAILNLPVCADCGVVAARAGAPILMNHEEVCEKGAKEKFGYYCERCFNRGFVYSEVDHAVREFGPFGQLH